MYRTAEVAKKPLIARNKFMVEPFQSCGRLSEQSYKGFTLREVVRKRRSVVDMDGVTVMERGTFYQIMLHCLSSGSRAREKQRKQMTLPFQALSWDSEVHAALFVHRVEGLPMGLYFLVRNEDHFDDLKRATRDEISRCSEKVYDSLSINDARKILMFSSDQELFEYIKEFKGSTKHLIESHSWFAHFLHIVVLSAKSSSE
ncbi:hypothetical protein LOK49_LG04G02454 [Camellia lanceoleosa]|uniref:Uncharacterized protein n=1 Tax=Camellia lanceoleosa TaxID=1840588 RepID=A0ACC0HXH7_9ERIC|nr:hypothetical protein LOK49_LG04G02454 [Camellia lanceoleosa]